MTVIDIIDMDDKHLKSCLRFANKYPAHASRLEALLHEWESRKASGTISLVPKRIKERQAQASAALGAEGKAT